VENFNLALLSPPVVIKKVSSDVRGLPQKHSEKEFSGVLTQEESRVDSASVNDDNLKNPAVEPEAAKTKKAAKSVKDQPVKNESSDITTENPDDDVQAAGENIFVAAAAEEVIEDKLPKSSRLTSLEVQALLTETSEEDNLVKSKQLIKVTDRLETQTLFTEMSEDVGSAKRNQLITVTKVTDNLEIQALFTEMSEDVVMPQTLSAVPELLVSDVEVDTLDEISVGGKKLITQDSDGNVNSNEGLLLSNFLVDNGLGKEGREPLLQGESAVNDFAVKLSPASIMDDSVDETAAEKVVEKLLALDSKMELAAADSVKKKIKLVENKHTENAKINVAAQNTASDLSAAAVMVAADQVVATSEEDGQHKTRVVERLSSQGGISLDELPAEVEVSVESETIVWDKKTQRKANYSNRLTGSNQLLSGSQTGAVHLQGRARENQSSLMQNGQGQKDLTDFAEGENNRGKAVFMDDLKQSVSDKVISESVLQNGVKEKPLQETNFSKSGLLVDVNSDLSNTSAAADSDN